jgi:GNAT superfamily N-acetyltransferase
MIYDVIRSLSMATSRLTQDDLIFRPLTSHEWPDFEQLFEEHGPQNGCWCMYWRTTRADCQRNFGEGNKQAFKAIVESDRVPGILAYHEGRAVGWCSIAPREDHPTLERSRTLKRVDDKPVWSTVCFFVSESYRRRGLMEALLRAAIAYAGANGAEIVEAYPLHTEITKFLPYERYMGIQSTFERVGFQPVAQRSERRVIMRYTIAEGRK